MKTNNTCAICQKSFQTHELISAELLSESLLKIIRVKVPDFKPHSFICTPDLNKFRAQYVKQTIEEGIGEITNLEEEVLQSINEQELIADNLNQEFEKNLTIGQRVADKIALFGGSWSFILSFASIIIIWILINVLFYSKDAFDPYPFILLNLVLSCLAALQAPVIMMSQNRQNEKDRLRAELDYKINLKAELEIRHLKSKLDQLASHQWKRLLEIQELQTELMEDLARMNRENKSN